MNILGKIDLSQFNKPKKEAAIDTSQVEAGRPAGLEKYNDSLDKFLSQMATKINAEYGYFLKADGSIDMESAKYEYSDKKPDQQRINDCEINFARENSKTVEAWQADREKTAGVVTEKTVTALLYKVLHKDFLVMRTSQFDDYIHGVDNLIVDKTTGVAICGFDEFKGGLDKQRIKQQKIAKTIAAGGVSIKYGLWFKDGEPKFRGLKNVPAFLLSLDSKQMQEILPTINQDSVTESEATAFANLINSLENQLTTLYDIGKIKQINLTQEQTDLEAEKETLIAKLGIGSWKYEPAGKALLKKLDQNHLNRQVLKFEKALRKIKNISKSI